MRILDNVMLLCLLILSICFKSTILNTKRSKEKIVKIVGKTACHSFPKDWWPFTPTTVQDLSLKVTRTIPHGSLHPILPFTLETSETLETLDTSENYNLLNLYDIKPTKFVDFRNSKAYKKLWERTNRGIHWLPPKPT